MKKVTVKYLLDNNNTIVERFLIENEKDIDTALAGKLITVQHKVGMYKILATGDKIILNEHGGYCGAKGVWDVVKHHPHVEVY